MIECACKSAGTNNAARVVESRVRGPNEYILQTKRDCRDQFSALARSSDICRLTGHGLRPCDDRDEINVSIDLANIEDAPGIGPSSIGSI